MSQSFNSEFWARCYQGAAVAAYAMPLTGCSCPRLHHCGTWPCPSSSLSAVLDSSGQSAEKWLRTVLHLRLALLLLLPLMLLHLLLQLTTLLLFRDCSLDAVSLWQPSTARRTSVALVDTLHARQHQLCHHKWCRSQQVGKCCQADHCKCEGALDTGSYLSDCLSMPCRSQEWCESSSVSW